MIRHCVLLVVLATAIMVLLPAISVAQLSVVEVWPKQNLGNVSVNEDVTVEFSTAVDLGFIDQSNFAVYSHSHGLHQGTYSQLTSRFIVFDPDDDFAAGDEVTVILTTGILSLLGAPLDHGYAWSFTVAAIDGCTPVFSSPVSYSIGRAPHCLGSGDLDSDGDIDIAVAISGADEVAIYMNDGSGGFSLHGSYPAGDSLVNLVIAEFDKDGDLDIATVNYFDEDISVLLNQGNGVFAAPVDYPLALGDPWSLVPIDLDNDSYFDLVVGERATPGGFSVLTNNGNGTFWPQVSQPLTNAQIISLATGDLNHDWYFDLMTSNWARLDVSVFLSNTFGGLVWNADYNINLVTGNLAVADFDKVSPLLPDLVAGNCNFANNDVTVLLGDVASPGSFMPPTNYAVGGVYDYSLCVGDFNGDSWIDVATGNTISNDVSIMLNDGVGGLALQNVLPVAVDVISIVTADIDADADLDLVLVGRDSDKLVVLFNRCTSKCGDADGSGFVNITDAVYLIQYIFNGGPEPDPYESGDANCDGTVNITDAVYLINYIFGGGFDPCDPDGDGIPDC